MNTPRFSKSELFAWVIFSSISFGLLGTIGGFMTGLFVENRQHNKAWEFVASKDMVRNACATIAARRDSQKNLDFLNDCVVSGLEYEKTRALERKAK